MKIRIVMNACIVILAKTWNIKGRKPVYQNLWGLPSIVEWFVEKGVSIKKARALIEIYALLRKAG